VQYKYSISEATLQRLRKMVEKQQADEGHEKVRVSYQHLGRSMDIDEIAEVMTGKIIEKIELTWGEDTMTMYLSDGSSVEIVIDSIYADIPELDD
jgi:CYTH domain-containing protein